MKYSILVLFLGPIITFDGLLSAKARKVSLTGRPLQKESWLEKERWNSGSHSAIRKILPNPTNRRKVVFMCQNQYFLVMKGKLAGTKNQKIVKKFGKS